MAERLSNLTTYELYEELKKRENAEELLVSGDYKLTVYIDNNNLGDSGGMAEYYGPVKVIVISDD